jgi:hypothetical protein
MNCVRTEEQLLARIATAKANDEQYTTINILRQINQVNKSSD